MKFAVIDTETTGLDPVRSTILEIAIAIVEDGRVVDLWSSKVKPTEEDLRLAHPKALEINGYAADPDAWADAPSWEDVAPKVGALLRDAMPVGHAVHFDLGMVRAVNERHGIRGTCYTLGASRTDRGRVPLRGVDTIALAVEHLAPTGLRRFSLDSIRAWLGWSAEGAHTAEKDVEDTARLFLLLYRASWWTRLRLRIDVLWRAGRG